MNKIQKPIRVLQINSGSESFGGVSSFLYNVYTHIDRECIQFDFLSPNVTTYGLHKEEIEKMGGKIYELGIRGNIISKKIKLYKKLKEFLKNNKYIIVHINSGNFYFNLFASEACRKIGIENVVVHSHSIANPNNSIVKNFLIGVLKKRLESNASHLFACSSLAAEFMFSKKIVEKGKVKIIKNGIDIDKFTYREEIRKQIREELGISDKIVIGHVGRFSPAKNHIYLVKVFSEFVKMFPNSVLMLIGDGPDRECILEQVEKLNIKNNVIFLGTKSDVEKYYQSMDVFVFPSKWEGLGMVLIEAQISGLPCIASTNVPREADITGNVTFLDTTEDNIICWVRELQKCGNLNRISRTDDGFKAGYDISEVSKDITNYYLSLMKFEQ